MADILLPAFHVTTVRKCQVEVPYEMGLDLDRYRAFYRQAYHADVAEAELIREMARRFMASDREFLTFKNAQKMKGRSAGKSAAVPESKGGSP